MRSTDLDRALEIIQALSGGTGFRIVERLAVGPAKVAAVADHCDITTANACVILRALVRKGLVRTPDGQATDRTYCLNRIAFGPLCDLFSAWADPRRQASELGIHGKPAQNDAKRPAWTAPTAKCLCT